MCIWWDKDGRPWGAGRRWLSEHNLPVEYQYLPYCLPPYSVVHSHHYQDCLALEHKAFVEESLPGLRYVWLRRRDLVATAVSTFLARRTGVYYAFDEETVQKQSSTPVQFHVDLLDLYWTICARDKFWEFYLSDEDECLTTYYEDLLDPQELRRVFNFLGIENEPIDPGEYHKLHHPMAEELKQQLRDTLDSGQILSWGEGWFKQHFEHSIPLL